MSQFPMKSTNEKMEKGELFLSSALHKIHFLKKKKENDEKKMKELMIN